MIFSSPIWISGLGAVTCSGSNPDTLWENAARGWSGIQNGLGAISSEAVAQLRDPFLKEFPHHEKSLFIAPPLLFTLTALRQAMQAAGWDSLNPDDGLIFATTTGHVSIWDEELIRYFQNPQSQDSFYGAFFYERLGLMLEKICEFLEFSGPRFLVTTACSASTHSLALAKMWIESGKVKRCLVGGTEVLSRLTIEGFRSFQLLSQTTARPFDVGRNGINLSEGSGFVCLEKEPERKLARLSGAGMSTDAYHMTAPHPEGKGSAQAMRMALKDAGITASELSWVHAHGTGSLHNDLAEAVAVSSLLGGKSTPVTSTKAVHGHALAATGILETVLCVKALEHQKILPTTGFSVADPKITLNVVETCQSSSLQHILKNTLGFGGANGAVVISRGDIR